MNGYVVAPDNFTGGLAASYSDKGALAAEAILAADDILFLPVAGQRFISSVERTADYGYYWSSSKENDDNVHEVEFSSTEIRYNSESPSLGNSVRLVKVQ